MDYIKHLKLSLLARIQNKILLKKKWIICTIGSQNVVKEEPLSDSQKKKKKWIICKIGSKNFVKKKKKSLYKKKKKKRTE